MANQNVTQLSQQTGTAAASSLFYAVVGGNTDTGLPLSVLVNSLGLTGTPTAPTATGGTNTTQIASCAFVQTTVGAYAPLASPALTGTPTAPTAAANTNTTQIATTAYVIGQAYAPLASPALTGTPTAPLAASGTNTTQLATTSFVQQEKATLYTPAFQATLSSAQSITAGTTTKIQFNNKVFDTNSLYDNTTNFRFTPNKAGKYMVTLNGSVNATQSALSSLTGVIRLNGSNTTLTYTTTAPNAAGGAISTAFICVGIVVMNGSTDFIEGWVNQGTGTTMTVTSGSTFSAYYLGA